MHGQFEVMVSTSPALLPGADLRQDSCDSDLMENPAVGGLRERKNWLECLELRTAHWAEAQTTKRSVPDVWGGGGLWAGNHDGGKAVLLAATSQCRVYWLH